MKTIIAILSIVILESIALFNNVNGILLSTCLMLIAGLGDLEIGKILKNT